MRHVLLPVAVLSIVWSVSCECGAVIKWLTCKDESYFREFPAPKSRYTGDNFDTNKRHHSQATNTYCTNKIKSSTYTARRAAATRTSSPTTAVASTEESVVALGREGHRDRGQECVREVPGVDLRVLVIEQEKHG